jgi:hypothetical protein
VARDCHSPATVSSLRKWAAVHNDNNDVGGEGATEA